MMQLVGALIILGLSTIWIAIAIATQIRETPRPCSLELAKPAADTFTAEEVITVTRRRTVKATRA